MMRGEMMTEETNELQTQKQEVEVKQSNGAERTRAARVYVPKVDIYSVDDGIVIAAEMPGSDDNSVDIVLEKNVLTINGFVAPQELDGYQLTYSEYGVGDYQRSFTLPEDIDKENIDAHMNNGVLRVILPKAPEAQAKKIAVKAG
jgi:HSP20 family molecular chaperone IbpA